MCQTEWVVLRSKEKGIQRGMSPTLQVLSLMGESDIYIKDTTNV